MDISAGAIGAIAAAITVPIVFALLRNTKTLSHSPNTVKSFEQLKAEYEKWELLALPLFLLFATIIGLALWQLFSLISDLQKAHLGGGMFLVYDPSLGLLLPPIFLAIFLSAVPMHFLYLRLLGPERYAEYTEYGNQKAGINSWKVLRYMAYVLVPVCIMGVVLSLDSYLKVTESDIRLNSFFGIGEQEYSFKEVRQLKLVKSFQAPNGNIVRNPYLIFAFSDGNEINFHQTLFATDIDGQMEIARFLSDRSGVPIMVDDPFPQ